VPDLIPTVHQLPRESKGRSNHNRAASKTTYGCQSNVRSNSPGPLFEHLEKTA